jgi:hypothetical protein
MQTDDTTKTEECLECIVTPHEQLPENNEPMVLKCVRCPFCRETVNAVLSATHISCPACKVVVRR